MSTVLHDSDDRAMRFDFDAAERRLLDTAESALPSLAVVHRVTEMLASQLQGMQTPPRPENPMPAFYKREASFLLSVIALRTARACLLVVAAGYMPESHGLKRRLSEVHARTQAIAHDPSGQHARQWLDGKPPKLGPIMDRFGNPDLWDIYSRNTHADTRGVHHWLTRPMSNIPDGATGLVITPQHDNLSNALLTEVGTECRDMAAIVATCRETKRDGIQTRLDRIQALDPELDALIARYYAN